MGKARANVETLKIRLADALKCFRDASKESNVKPKIRRNKTQRRYGIVRKGSDYFNGMDRNWLAAVTDYGWVKLAEPAGGGRKGHYWDGPSKVFQGKPLGEIIQIYYENRDAYETKKKEEKKAERIAQQVADRATAEEAAKEEPPPPAEEKPIYRKKPKQAPVGKKFPVISTPPCGVEVLAVIQRPEDELNMMQAYQSCLKVHVQPPEEIRAFMKARGLDAASLPRETVSAQKYAKLVEPDIASVDLLALLADHPNVSNIVLRSGSACTQAL